MIRRLFLGLALAVSAGCSPVELASAALGVVSGGGPNVAANTLAGRTNVQSIGGVDVTDFRIEGATAERIVQSSGASKVKAERVQQVVVNEAAPGLPVWAQFALAGFLWWLPSNREISTKFREWRVRRRDAKNAKVVG